MSNKKRTRKRKIAKKKSSRGFWILLIALAAILILTVLLLLWSIETLDNQPAEVPAAIETQSTKTSEILETQSIEASASQETVTDPTITEPAITVDPSSVNLGYGICITDIGSYTGAYMEDGSDEILSDVLMMIVKNDGEQDIQLARITMDIGEAQAVFSATTLPVGESMVLLEQNRMTCDEAVDYAAILPELENIAYFQEPISTCEDQLEIQIIDGALNITNISGADIAGKITVYYKNAAEDLLYGGITYTVSIEGGLKADELRQIMTKHASDTGSRIMFVTIRE